MLAREVLRMRGTISREHPWEVMPDLYFYRDPEEVGGLWKEVWLCEVSCLLLRTGFTNVILHFTLKVVVN